MQISIDIILNYISVYQKCWPVHSTINFNHISKTIEAVMKLHIKMYLSQKQKVQLIAYNININYNTLSFIEIHMQLNVRKHCIKIPL